MVSRRSSVSSSFRRAASTRIASTAFAGVRRRFAARSGLRPDDPRVLAVALDDDPVPWAQAGVGGLRDDDRPAAVELDEDLLACPVLDLILDRIACEAAAERPDDGPGAAVADLVSNDAARRGPEDGAGADLMIALDLDLLDARDDAGTDG